jgi:hypothetical protein
MSLAQHRFVEGFIKRCSQLGMRDQNTVLTLLKYAAKDALDATEQVYKKMGKSPCEYQRNPELVGEAGHNTGTSAYEETREHASDKPTRT